MIRSCFILEALDSVMRDPIVDTAFACPKCDYRFTGPSRVPWLSMILCPKCGSRIEFAPESEDESGQEQEADKQGKEEKEETKPKKKKKKPKSTKKPKKKETEAEAEEIEAAPGSEDWESELDSYLK
jgi:hypothetical protein